MLVLLEGIMGKGKTLTATWFALTTIEDAKRQFELGLGPELKLFSTTPIYSTYGCSCGDRHRIGEDCIDGGECVLEFPVNYTPLTLESFWDLQSGPAEDINDSVIILDEGYLYFDSRRSQSRLNINNTNFLAEIRKRNITILCATHDRGKVDRRTRELTSLFLYPRYSKITKTIRLTGRYASGKLFRPRVIKAWRFFACFDTNTPVKPAGKMYRVKREDLR